MYSDDDIKLQSCDTAMQQANLAISNYRAF